MTGTIARFRGIARRSTAAVSLLAPVSPEVRLAALAITIGSLLYIMLFAEIPAVHDMTHSLRHSVLGVPCH